VKADGLAAGKGVVVAASEAEALAAIDAMIETGAFGEAGSSLVIEEWLDGEEVSLFALCDGTTALPLGAAQDHKRVGEDETGPNTGGMGAYSPAPSFPEVAQETAINGIIRPALAEMVRRGTPFRGVLYAGLMLTASGAKLIEFNVRFGDPECQALLPRLMSDLLPALQAAYDGELANFNVRWRDEASIAVVMAARGYRMVRYADDFVVLCKSHEEATAALTEITAWVTTNGLRLHPDKTHVGDCRQPGQGFEFLGYRFEAGRRFVREKSLNRFKDRIREKTRRTRGDSLARVIDDLNPTLSGWFGYFKHAHPTTFPALDGFIRRRLRAMLRKQQKRPASGRRLVDHQRWPNAFFAQAGLLALNTAWLTARHSR